jgi:hypothetical protein
MHSPLSPKPSCSTLSGRHALRPHFAQTTVRALGSGELDYVPAQAEFLDESESLYSPHLWAENGKGLLQFRWFRAWAGGVHAEVAGADAV